MAKLTKQPPGTLLRVHRSAPVVLAHVRRWANAGKGAHRLLLSDGSEITVGPSHLQ